MSPPGGMGPARRRATATMSAVMALIGVALIVRTLAAGGGPVSVGVLLGLLFLAAGAGRLWVMTHMEEK